MNTQKCIGRILAFACFALIIMWRGGWTGAQSGMLPHASGWDQLPVSTGVTNDCFYTLTARVRFLFLSYTRPGVGEARISRDSGADGPEGIELLVGSDPERTPMRINRWGYIAERATGQGFELLGVMTESDEESVEEARNRLAQSGSGTRFKAIRGSQSDGKAQSTVMRLMQTEVLTYKDVGLLLCRLPSNGPSVQRIDVPPGAYPGFLWTVNALVYDSIRSLKQNSADELQQTVRRRYVYGSSLYELTRKSTRFRPQAEINGCRYDAVIESEFENRNLKTREISKFNIAYGTENPIAGVPLRIVYKPKWWFEAELLLDRRVDVANSLETGDRCKSGAR